MYINFWYPVALSKEVTNEAPVQAEIMGLKFVAFRDTEGKAHATESGDPSADELAEAEAEPVFGGHIVGEPLSRGELLKRSLGGLCTGEEDGLAPGSALESRCCASHFGFCRR